MADMVVAAFSTGVSRVATWDATNTHFTDETVNDWHGQVAHGALEPMQRKHLISVIIKGFLNTSWLP